MFEHMFNVIDGDVQLKKNCNYQSDIFSFYDIAKQYTGCSRKFYPNSFEGPEKLAHGCFRKIQKYIFEGKTMFSVSNFHPVFAQFLQYSYYNEMTSVFELTKYF